MSQAAMTYSDAPQMPRLLFEADHTTEIRPNYLKYMVSPAGFEPATY